MSLPGYLKIESTRRTPEGVTMVIGVRAWHPSFWHEFTKGALQIADGIGVSRWSPRLWWYIARALVRGMWRSR